MNTLFEKETETLEKFGQLLTGDRQKSETEYREALVELHERYGELLGQVKFLTKISDRLENRLRLTNQLLERKNIELKNALRDLLEARAGKRALTIIYIAAALLFIFEEVVIEPFIPIFGQLLLAGILIKLAIALVLKSIEGVIEGRLLKRKIQKISKENS